MYVDAVIRLHGDYSTEVKQKQLLASSAQFALENLGAGGNPDADKIEAFLGWINTRVLDGYVRIRISASYGQALEYLAENGGSPYAELVRVEWPDLGPYDVMEWDEIIEGEPIHRRLGEF